MSVINQAIQGVQARVLWSCNDRCVELIELGVREACGYFNAFRYEVHIAGESSLFESSSEHAALQYLEMLLGSGLNGQEDSPDKTQIALLPAF